MADAAHEQIQIQIPINVGEHRARGKLSRASKGWRCYFLELPIAKIAKQRVVTFESSQVNIAPPVPIIIAKRHPGAEFVNAIALNDRVGKPVREVKGSDFREARFAVGRDLQLLYGRVCLQTRRESQKRK